MEKIFSIKDENYTYSKAIWLALGKKMQEDQKILI